ncbi:hypothetical protein IWQ56_006674, partial [Coemansia nantahalensis]
MFSSLIGSFGSVARGLCAAAVLRPALGGPQAQAVRGMAKLKTHKGTSKRWKAIANGLYQRRQAGLRHLNRNLSPAARRGKHAPVV